MLYMLYMYGCTCMIVHVCLYMYACTCMLVHVCSRFFVGDNYSRLHLVWLDVPLKNNGCSPRDCVSHMGIW